MANSSGSAALRQKEISCTARCSDNSATCRTPAVLAIEDVHWADEATLDLLSYLGRRIQHLRVLLLVTYRDDALVANDPLRLTLGALASQRATRRLTLGALSTAGVATLAAGQRD